MKSEPKSGVLFLAICSLTKESGGKPEYDDGQGIAAALPDFRDRLLKRREEVRHLIVKRSTELTWGGKPLPDLEFNSKLKKGSDFGGRKTANYLPAIHRYQGRFFQALGEEGRKKLCQPQRHALFLSGLYGLLCPTESIQLYSCPLLNEVSEIWRKDSLLTELLSEYIDKNSIKKVFDMTALSAYRDLINWQEVGTGNAEILHCFDTMAPGGGALVSFGRILRSHLLDLSEEELILLPPDDRRGNVVFSPQPQTPHGLPEEAPPTSLPKERRESLPENEDSPECGENITNEKREEWNITFTRRFVRDVKKYEEIYDKMMGTVLDMAERGHPPSDVKPLRGKYEGSWRYRFGDYRLIYDLDKKGRSVCLKRLEKKDDNTFKK